MNRRRVKRQMLKRRQAEEELLGHKLLRQTFFQNNHAAMLIFDTVEGRILDANPAARKFYGYDKKTFSGMMISELSVVPLESIWTKLKDLQNIGSDHFESRHKLANGEIKDVEVYAGSINLGSKQVLYAIIHDITHRKQAEVAFSRKNAEFERFVHTVAHDLHNPLLTIRSMLNLFLGEMKENKDPESQRDLIYIKSAADSMHEKIGGLLQLSKASHISSAVFSMEVDFLDIIDLCRSSIVEKNKGMNLESATANIREGRIRTVKTGFVQQQNEVVFYVRDNESGIDPNDKEQIFETFFDYSSQARGVGLALVKKLVESYGGRIWVESKGLGKECCIKFTLPEAVKPASSQRDQKGQTI